jgi:hypothetical protein
VKLNNSKNIFEVVGIAAVVASLIFVGMEIRQSQEIAIASQYQSRIEFNLGFFDAIDAQGFLSVGERFKQRVSESNLPDESKQGFLQIDSASLGRAAIELRRILFIFDNNHYQYRAGFVDEESWQAIRRRMKNVLAGNSIMRYEIVGRPDQWRDSLRHEFEQMLEELEKDK